MTANAYGWNIAGAPTLANGAATASIDASTGVVYTTALFTSGQRLRVVVHHEFIGLKVAICFRYTDGSATGDWMSLGDGDATGTGMSATFTVNGRSDAPRAAEIKIALVTEEYTGAGVDFSVPSLANVTLTGATASAGQIAVSLGAVGSAGAGGFSS